MRGLFHIGVVAVVVAVASWAYSVNYAAIAAEERVEALEAAIAEERRALRVLAVEWAWLNRPERLTGLVARYNTELGLMPLDPAHYGDIRTVAYPVDDLLAPRPVPQPGRGPLLPMTLDEALMLSRGGEVAE
ncbi:MAG: cell division protein FtsL [Rubricella sp.]